MQTAQPGILLPVPQNCRYLTFGLVPGADPSEALKRLKEYGVERGWLSAWGSLWFRPWEEVEGLRPFPTLVGPGVDIPATPAALWVWLGGDDPGKLVHRANALKELLAPAFRVDEVVDGFKHDETPEGMGRDLSGYEDGTENPDDEEAVEAAVVRGRGPGMDGSSFVAAQRWIHDLSTFQQDVAGGPGPHHRAEGERQRGVGGRP